MQGSITYIITTKFMEEFRGPRRMVDIREAPAGGYLVIVDGEDLGIEENFRKAVALAMRQLKKSRDENGSIASEASSAG